MKQSTRVLLVVVGVVVVFVAAVLGYGLFVLNGMRHYSPLGFSEWNGNVIAHVGKYGLRDGERIQVGIEHDNTVGFEFFSTDGRKIAMNDVRASANKHWSLHVDSNKWIWLNSEDIGTHVWTTYTTGRWESRRVRGDKELEKLAPAGFAGR